MLLWPLRPCQLIAIERSRVKTTGVLLRGPNLEMQIEARHSHGVWGCGGLENGEIYEYRRIKMPV